MVDNRDYTDLCFYVIDDGQVLNVNDFDKVFDESAPAPQVSGGDTVKQSKPDVSSIFMSCWFCAIFATRRSGSSRAVFVVISGLHVQVGRRSQTPPSKFGGQRSNMVWENV